MLPAYIRYKPVEIRTAKESKVIGWYMWYMNFLVTGVNIITAKMDIAKLTDPEVRAAIYATLYIYLFRKLEKESMAISS